ncbi:MAG: gamma-glutamyl-gamma-aminobutyrate hydrolase family protein [Alphaproteobacteria bacterium]|nr:gamma-glutamyl-gamma-aminobutyrate hydrolase family protein [Alphaproteobacteria bacterium]
MASQSSLPSIGIPSCVRAVGEHPFHAVGEKYISAVAEWAGGLPFLIPALGAALDPAELVLRLDGLFLTGSRSNVEPHHYGGAASRPGTLHDPQRDATTLPLIRAAVAAGLPVLAVCRGIQELNAALGGTLHQLVHEIPGRRDHRSPPGTVAEKYAHTAHPVRLTPGGLFARLADASELMVNSLHAQGIDRLAPGLAVEATAPDGQIEAVSAPNQRFVVGVQWHPEYRVGDNAFSVALFAAFGAACRNRAATRLQAA